MQLVAGANLLRVFRLVPAELITSGTPSQGQNTKPPKMKLVRKFVRDLHKRLRLEFQSIFSLGMFGHVQTSWLCDGNAKSDLTRCNARHSCDVVLRGKVEHIRIRP